MQQVWLVTGSARGLGRAIGEAVLAAGHCLVATARDITQLTDLLASGERVRSLALDVTDPLAAQSAVQSAFATFGRLDVLVNNAGYANFAAIEDTTLDDFRAQVETNLFGVINVTKAALPLMRRQGHGHIIQISSVGGRVGPVGRGAYAAAKWGVEGFSEVLAKETRSLGIRVTLVEPGGFRTGFAESQTIVEPMPSYLATLGAAAAFQRDFHGKQPGDPHKAAQAILQIAQLAHPPLRLLLGSDAVTAVEQADLARTAADLQWRSVSRSTDF